MARRLASPNSVDPFADLAKKSEILERELAQQRAAIDRLKELGSREPAEAAPADVRKTA